MLTCQALPGTDLAVSQLCLGGGPFGTGCIGGELDRLLGEFRDLGGNFVDTAHCYASWLPDGTGASERALGDWLRRSGAHDMVVATKGGHPPFAGYEADPDWLSPQRLAADLDDSLARLRVETVDLYWLHRDQTERPVGEIIETLNSEVRRGRIRWFGASNWRSARVAEANAYAAEHGLRGFVASSPEWHLASRNIPAEQSADTSGQAMVFLPPADEAWHVATGFPLIPYSANACGWFARGGPTYDNPTSQARLQRCRELAAALDGTPALIALAWLLAQPYPVIPIIGTTRGTHLREAVAAAHLVLSPEQVAWLRDG